MQEPAPVLRGLAPLLDERTETVILGTFPGEKSLRLKQYYSDPRNRFWEIIGPIIGVRSQCPYEARCAALLAHQLGLWDVIAACRRVGSTDTGILDARPNDLRGFLLVHPQVRRLLFNGVKDGPLGYFRQFRRAGRIEMPDGPEPSTLPSSSSTNTHANLAKKTEAWCRVLTA